MIDRRSFLLAAGATGAAAVAGCSAPTDDGGRTTTAVETTTAAAPATPGETLIEMTDDLKFVPQEVTVPVGETVVWENVGSVAHSVTAYEDNIPADADYFASGDFDSESAARSAYPTEGSVGKGETYSHTFRVPGEYNYFCIPHERGMQGTITVEER